MGEELNKSAKNIDKYFKEEHPNIILTTHKT
jgi:hypothetical protein